MFSRIVLSVVFISASLLAPTAFAGRVELTTYYPAPSGEYKTLSTTENALLATSSGGVSIGSSLAPASNEKLRINAGENIYQISLLRGDVFKGGLNTNGGIPTFQNGLGAYVQLNDTAVNLTGNQVGVFGNLYVMSGGSIGVGTTTPAAGTKLEVQGGAIKATNGLIIETRTTDPATPEDGRMWLRTA